MKGIGKMIYKMDTEQRHGPIIQSMKEIIQKVKNKEKALIPGQTDLDMLETGMIIKLTVMAYILGLMDALTKDLGRTIICMDKVFTLGLTVEDTRVNTLWIKNMDMVFTYGQMVADMKDTGLMVSNTDKEDIQFPMEKLKQASGRMENV